MNGYKMVLLEPCSSAYASQVLVVRKKDGSPRVCIDFRKLNRVLVKDHYPLPLIEDILDKLQDTRVFSTIDLRNGFVHVPVNKQSRPYTSFVTQKWSISVP
ncbi:transposon Ty3-G Gag-Pol polyprotein [Trichonephila clavipes]|nr:transposon Ty3-G Gag-Pol polyprotein [Trichonephila clavipes]